MVKTVEVSKETWEKMKKLLEAGHAKSYDELISKLMDRRLVVPNVRFQSPVTELHPKGSC